MLSFSLPSPLYLSLLLFLLYHSPVLSCKTGTRSECESAAFVPGYNLVGEGFDVVTMQRKGAFMIDFIPKDNCTLCSNPFQDNKLQKLPSSGTDWRASNQCKEYNSKHTAVRYAAIKYYLWESANLQLQGTLSKVYKFATERTSEDEYTFSTHRITCTYYSFRVSCQPSLSAEFKSDLESLPSTYGPATKEQYRMLIETYGTHYIYQVKLGGRLRRVIAVRTCLTKLNGLSSDEVNSCFSLGIKLGLGKISPSAISETCSKVLQNQDLTALYSSRLYAYHTEVAGGTGWVGEFSLTHNNSVGFMNWLETLKDHPDVVEYFLVPMYRLAPHRPQLKEAIEEYIKDNAVRNSNSKTCTQSPNLDSSCCPKQAWRGTLEVTIIRAWGLKGDLTGKTEGYAKLFFGGFSERTRMIRSNDPQWNERFQLGNVDTHSNLYIEIWDLDVKHDDLLGSCQRSLMQGTHSHTCHMRIGSFQFRYTLTCDRHLTGTMCNQYTPTPV
uniref:MACPF domain-containing protein n=1 Tax=Monopterus albus TaxID=43700 RepID=A0A3Q3K0H7_MONAL